MKDDERLYLPVLHSFENGNIYTGSLGALRFRIEPKVTMKNAKELDRDASSVEAVYWHGKFCFEKSEPEGEKTFPMTEEGREELRTWLLQQA